MSRRDADVLVTGGGGFLGGALVARLAGSGARVRATVHRTPPADIPGVEWLSADLTRPEDCARAVAGVARVLHCANTSGGAGVTSASPLALVTASAVVNAQLLEAAWRSRVARFVFLSSSVVYPDVGARPVREDEAHDGEPAPAYHAVGGMKRYGEHLCEIYARRLPRVMPCTVIRPANVYGPGDRVDLDRANVTGALVRKVLERRRPLEVWGTGDEVRDLLYVDDFVDGLLAAAALEEPWAAFNLGSGRGVTVRELLRVVLAADGWADAHVVFAPDRPRTIAARVLDTTALWTRTGFTPRTALAGGIAHTMAWCRTRLDEAGQVAAAHG